MCSVLGLLEPEGGGTINLWNIRFCLPNESVMSQKTWIFSNIIVTTSGLTPLNLMSVDFFIRPQGIQLSSSPPPSWLLLCRCILLLLHFLFVDVSCLQVDICDIHATCTYSESSGKAICMCNPGYQGDGILCTPTGAYVGLICRLCIMLRLCLSWSIIKDLKFWAWNQGLFFYFNWLKIASCMQQGALRKASS